MINLIPGLKRITLLSLFMFVAVAACNTKINRDQIVFESIEQRIWPGTGEHYEDHQPGLIIISQSNELENVRAILTEETNNKLADLDYSEYFALIVFQGLKMNSGFTIQVSNISRIGNTVDVYVNIHEPQQNEEKADVVTSPYHVVLVPKAGNWDTDITFNLVSNELILKSITHTFP